MPTDRDSKKEPAAILLQRRLRRIVTLAALVLALAHLIWPKLAIDAITLGLLAIAVVPWLAPLIKSLELPGGWKVELQEMYQVSARAQDAGLIDTQAGAPVGRSSGGRAGQTGGQSTGSPRLSALTAPRQPIGSSGPVVESRAVCAST